VLTGLSFQVFNRFLCCFQQNKNCNNYFFHNQVFSSWQKDLKEATMNAASFIDQLL